MKFYAVRRGHTPGIYTTWGACKKMVDGFSHARYKSFPTLDQAAAFLDNEDQEDITTTQEPIDTAETRKRPRIDDEKQQCYCDGGCRDNGTISAVGGVGILITGPPEQRISEMLPKQFNQTNQVAELYALYRTLMILSPYVSADIYSDSMYAIKVFSEFLPNWEANGFKLCGGGTPSNLELILDIQKLMKFRQDSGATTDLFHVSAHVGVYGNEIADTLASEGIKKGDNHKIAEH